MSCLFISSYLRPPNRLEFCLVKLSIEDDCLFCPAQKLDPKFTDTGVYSTMRLSLMQPSHWLSVVGQWWTVLNKSRSIYRSGCNPVLSGKGLGEMVRPEWNQVVPWATSYQPTVGRLKGKGGDKEIEVISWVALTIQGERSRFSNTKTWTKSGEMPQTG